MDVRRLCHWLAILAIALHSAWPLVANAKPESVHLVPLCTVDGVTHDLEVPGGKTPLDDSASAHREHCSFCFLGAGALLPSDSAISWLPDSASERISSIVEDSRPTTSRLVHGARAPPSFSVVIANYDNFGEQGETDPFAGRVGTRARYSERFMRLGLLHGRYAVEHAGSDD